MMDLAIFCLKAAFLCLCAGLVLALMFPPDDVGVRR